MKKTFILLFGLSLIFLGGCSVMPGIFTLHVSGPHIITGSTLVENTGNVQCLPTTTPYIKVLSPNGGEVFTDGQQITVTWTSCNIQPAPSAGGLGIVIALQGLISDGQSSSEFIAQVSNDGQSIITLPTSISNHPMLYGKNFKISVSRNDPSAQTKMQSDISDTSFTIIPTGVLLHVSEQTSKYVVKHEMTGGSNAENVDVYLSGKLIFSKPAAADGSFYKLVGDIIFIDYGTSPQGREIRLFDLSNKGKMIFEARYDGGDGVQIDADIMYFNYGFSAAPKGAVCPNYPEIKKMGGSVIYMQKRSYNFKTHALKNVGKIYCGYGE